MVKEISPMAPPQETEPLSVGEIKRLQDQLKITLEKFCSHFRPTPQVKLTAEIIYAPDFVDQWTNYFVNFFVTLKSSSEVAQVAANHLTVDLYKKIQMSLFQNRNLSKNDQEIFLNFYHRRIGNLSLAEIEKLPIPFNLESFEKANDYFKQAALDDLSVNFNPSMPRIFERIPLPFMYLALSEKPPPKIAPLAERAKAYFNFWKKVIIDYQIDESQEEAFLQYFGQWPQDNFYLFTAVLNNLRLEGFHYFAIFQMLHSRKNQSLRPQEWESIIDNFYNAQKHIGEVFGRRASKEFMEGYSLISFKPESEEQMSNFLTQTSTQDISIGEYADLIISNEQISGQIASHPQQVEISQISRLVTDSYETESNVLGINKVEVFLTKQTWPTLFLNFKESQSLLQVQITNKGEVFGIPSLLEEENKALAESVKNTILKIYLEYLNYRQKAQEAKSDQNSTHEKKAPEKDEANLPKISAIINYSFQRTKLPPVSSSKRKAQRFLQFPQTPQQEKKTEPNNGEEQRRRRVFYDRNQIMNLPGQNIDERTLKRVLRALHSFEAGLGDFKKLEKARYGSWVIDKNTFRLRTGRMRILLKKDGDIYSPILIGRRQSGQRYSLTP